MKQHLYKWKQSKKRPDMEKLSPVCGATTTHPEWARAITDKKVYQELYKASQGVCCKKCYDISQKDL